MKKIIILCLLLMITFGCSATYNFSVDNDLNTTEELIINNFEAFVYYSDFEQYVDDTYQYSDILFEKIGDSNSYYLKASRDSKIANLNKSDAYGDNFGELTISNDKRSITFVPNYDKCIYSFYEGDSESGENSNSNLVINLTIPFRVVESNADEVNGEVYTWEYDINSCAKIISVKYSVITKTQIYITVGIVISLIIVILSLVNKSKKSNAI